MRRHESSTKWHVQRVMRSKLGPSGLSIGCHRLGHDLSVALSCLAGPSPDDIPSFRVHKYGGDRAGSGNPILRGLSWTTAHWRWLKPCPSAVQLVGPADDFGLAHHPGRRLDRLWPRWCTQPASLVAGPAHCRVTARQFTGHKFQSHPGKPGRLIGDWPNQWSC